MDEVVKELVKVIIHQGKQIHALQEAVKTLAEDSSKGQELVIGFAAKHLDDIKSYQTFVIGNATKTEPVRRPNVIKTTLEDLNGGSTLTNYEERMENLCKTVEDSFEVSNYSVKAGNRNRAESESTVSSTRYTIISSPLPSRKEMSPSRRQTSISNGSNSPGSPVPDKLNLKGQSSNALPKGAVSILEFNELKKEVGSLNSTCEHIRDSLVNKAEKNDVETREFHMDAKIVTFNDTLLKHINSEIERLEGVVIEKKDDQDGSMITTKQLCVGCGRRSYTRSPPLEKLPSDAFFPVINSNITPGDDIFRAGFRVPGKKIIPTHRAISPSSSNRPKKIKSVQNDADADEYNSLALRDISLNEYSYGENIPETDSLHLNIGESGFDAIETSRTGHSSQTKATSTISIDINVGTSPIREPFAGDIDDEMTEDGHAANDKGTDLSPLLAVGKTVNIEGSKSPLRKNIDETNVIVGPYVPSRRGLKTAPAGALRSIASPNEEAKLLRSIHRKGFPKGKIKVSNNELNELLLANTMPILQKK